MYEPIVQKQTQPNNAKYT